MGEVLADGSLPIEEKGSPAEAGLPGHVSKDDAVGAQTGLPAELTLARACLVRKRPTAPQLAGRPARRLEYARPVAVTVFDPWLAGQEVQVGRSVGEGFLE